MKVFVAGIATETNTFSPIPTGLANFAMARDLAENASVSCGGVGEIARRCEINGDTFVHGLLAFAEPSGITVRPAYESMRQEILDALSQHKDVDMVLLLLHGAMVADGYDDCEADLAQCCRDIVGRDVVIGVELDLHGHIDRRLLDAATLVKSYKEYPHVDITEVAGELYDACRDAAAGLTQPVCAMVDCKMVGLFSTFREPVRSFVKALKAAEAQERVIAVNFNHGFPWGDVQHNGARMLVFTDNDPALAESLALSLSRELFRIREAARLPSVLMDDAMRRAVASTARPVVLADQSDNAGGGAPADSTFALQWLINNGVKNVGIAFIYDPEVVKTAMAAGEGATLRVRLGGKTSPASGDPIDLTVTVVGIKRNYMHDFPQEGASPVYTRSGDTVALESDGIYLIVNSARTQCFSKTAFYDFGLDNLDIYIPKSTNHFMSGFGDIAAEVIHMAAPGAVQPLVQEIPFTEFQHDGVWPWSDNVEPELMR